MPFLTLFQVPPKFPPALAEEVTFDATFAVVPAPPAAFENGLKPLSVPIPLPILLLPNLVNMLFPTPLAIVAPAKNLRPWNNPIPIIEPIVPAAPSVMMFFQKPLLFISVRAVSPVSITPFMACAFDVFHWSCMDFQRSSVPINAIAICLTLLRISSIGSILSFMISFICSAVSVLTSTFSWVSPVSSW